MQHFDLAFGIDYWGENMEYRRKNSKKPLAAVKNPPTNGRYTRCWGQNFVFFNFLNTDFARICYNGLLKG
jgi:hypothetical protein